MYSIYDPAVPHSGGGVRSRPEHRVYISIVSCRRSGDMRLCNVDDSSSPSSEEGRLLYASNMVLTHDGGAIYVRPRSMLAAR